MSKLGVSRAVCLLALLTALGSMCARANAAPGLLVGVDDDTVKWLGRPNGLVGVTRDLDLDAVRVTIPWRHGRTRPNRLVGTYLHRVALTMALGQRVVLAVYGRPDQAPMTPASRAQYCGFLSHVLARLPVRDVVIWNEANSPTFWPTAAGAPAYEALLADCWTTLHRLGRPVNVISSTAARHDPAGFIRELGIAYRASVRAAPIVDTFGHNPYPLSASEPPWAQHPDDPTVIGQGDLPTLLAAYETAFAGTGQPVPGTGSVTVWYLEDGFQTTIPSDKRRFYRGAENDRYVVPPVANGSGEQRVRLDQARQLSEALKLAYCQPAVGAFFNFELMDEARLRGWQSGVLWRDGTPKPSYESFKGTIEAVKAGNVDCSTVTGGGS